MSLELGCLLLSDNTGIVLFQLHALSIFCTQDHITKCIRNRIPHKYKEF
jgi:hypothetical protein